MKLPPLPPSTSSASESLLFPLQRISRVEKHAFGQDFLREPSIRRRFHPTRCDTDDFVAHLEFPIIFLSFQSQPSVRIAIVATHATVIGEEQRQSLPGSKRRTFVRSVFAQLDCKRTRKTHSAYLESSSRAKRIPSRMGWRLMEELWLHRCRSGAVIVQQVTLRGSRPLHGESDDGRLAEFPEKMRKVGGCRTGHLEQRLK